MFATAPVIVLLVFILGNFKVDESNLCFTPISQFPTLAPFLSLLVLAIHDLDKVSKLK